MKRLFISLLPMTIALLVFLPQLQSQSFIDQNNSIDPTGIEYSAHARQDLEFYEPRNPVKYYDMKTVWRTVEAPPERSLNRVVFGYLPYWERSTSAEFFRYDLLSHLAVFSWGMSSGGNLSSPAGWPSEWTGITDKARQSGVRLIACITEFDADEMHTVLTTYQSRINFINQVSGLIQNYDLHGVNLDFESPKTSDRGAVMNGFVAQIRDSLKVRFGPYCEVSFAGPVVNWSNYWDLKGLAAACDHVFIMAYAFWGSWSTTTGPNSPLEGSGICIRKSLEEDYKQAIDTYPDRIVLGIPYYGHKWISQSGEEGSAVISGGSSIFYSSAASTYQTWGRKWSSRYQVPWTGWYNGGWTQIWCDDAQSLGLKYDMTRDKNIGGTGMWALAYDEPYKHLWQALAKAYYTYPDSLILADFEENAGPFNTDPTYSGSTHGLDRASSIALSTESANSGSYSLKLTLVDYADSDAARTLRLLCNYGRAYLNHGFAPSGELSFSLKCTSGHNGSVRLLLDDVADGTEMTAAYPIINDGNWHEYRWNLTDSLNSFLAGDGMCEGPVLTLDAVYFEIEGDLSDALFFLDNLNYVADTESPSSVAGANAFAQHFQLIGLYPNPFNSQITLNANVLETGKLSLILYNVAGQKVWAKEMNSVATGNYTLSFNINNLASGMYILESSYTSQKNPADCQHFSNKITLLK